MKKIHCPRLLSFWILLMVIALSGCASTRKSEEARRYTDRDRANLLITAAVGAMNERDPIAALEYLEKAESIDPEYAPIFHARTQAFLMKKDQPRALMAIEKALKLSPADSGVLNTAGKLMVDAGRLNEAEGHLLKAAEDPLFREAFKARTSLGILYYKKNQLDLAEKQLARAIEENPSQACVAYYYRGHLLMKRGKLSDATRSYERASSKVCANFAEAHLAQGIALERARKYDQARRKYLELQQVFPESPIAEQAMIRLKQLP